MHSHLTEFLVNRPFLFTNHDTAKEKGENIGGIIFSMSQKELGEFHQKKFSLKP
jgi:hypothetical protein